MSPGPQEEERMKQVRARRLPASTATADARGYRLHGELGLDHTDSLDHASSCCLDHGGYNQVEPPEVDAVLRPDEERPLPRPGRLWRGRPHGAGQGASAGDVCSSGGRAASVHSSIPAACH